MPQQQFKLGLRPPKRAPSIKLSHILTGVIPPHPVQVDYLAMLSNWKMLGNDNYGVCGPVMCANYVREVTNKLSTEYYPTQQEVFDLYKTQNPNFIPNPNNPIEDNGVDLQTMLEYWNKNTWAGRKLIAFASVDYTNIEEVKAAITIFGHNLLGITVQQSNFSNFISNDPWDYYPNDSDAGGHAVLGGGYLGMVKDDIQFITWAKETGFTQSFWNHKVDQAWIAILPEHLGTKAFMEGIDIDTLAADYKILTGRDLPIPNTNIPVTGVSINPDILSLEVGQIAQLDAIVNPANATNQSILWLSADPAIATVDTNGFVAAEQIGMTKITVTTIDGNFTSTCPVIVSAKKPGCLTTLKTIFKS